MEHSKTFLMSLLDSLADGVYFVDRNRRITYWNTAAQRITGYSADEVIGRCCYDNLLMHVDDDGNQLCVGRCPLVASIETGDDRLAEVYLRHRDGHRVPVWVKVSPITDDEGTIRGAVEIFNSNEATLQTQEKIRRLEEMAFKDPLTGLVNRRFVELAMEDRLHQARRFGWQCGLLMIDVDHFKQFNDTYGHDVGDEVLGMVAHTLRFNSGPQVVVGRWGGEEFVVLVDHTSAEGLAALARRCCGLVAASRMRTWDRHLSVTVSVGAALWREEDTSASLLKRADACLYASKRDGRNRATVDIDGRAAA